MPATAELHVSNATTQHWVFFYREKVEGAPTPLLRSVSIRAGRQEIIRCAPDQKGDIIEQLERAGAHDAAETHRKIDRFHGLIYRDSGQISADEIMMGHASVQTMQKDRSVEQATTSALAADRAANPIRGQRRTKSTTIEVEQELSHGQRPTGNEVAFSVSVDTEEGGSKLIKKAVA